METGTALPLLTAEEIRVLGVLIEKNKVTPDYYPMTVNAITAACNQKSSRNPIVEYDESTVMDTIRSLISRGLVSTSIGGGSRVNKYKHNFEIHYPLTDADAAILCLLFLRGPQTPGELNTNAGRLYEFQSLASVLETLNKLSQNNPPFVKELPKRPGQKEARFTHLFGETIADADSESETVESPRKSSAELEARLSAVEQELAEVKEKLERLMKELMG